MRMPLLLTVLTGVALTAWTGETSAGPPRVHEVSEKIAGKTYPRWTVAWFQWALSIDKERNPITDTTGAFAGEGQSGPVWFLAGNFGGTTRRKVTVPAGKPIFSPVLYSLTGAFLGGESDEKTWLATSQKIMDRAMDMEVTLDGKSLGDVSKNRVASGVFSFTAPDETDAVHPSFAGKQRAAADGYWVMLAPLSRGEHVLRFKGRLQREKDKTPFMIDITYELKVAGNSKP